MSKLAFGVDFAFEFGYHFVHISKTEPESFHIVAVACGNAIEFVENFLQVVLLDAYAVVGNGDFETLVGEVASAHLEK